MSALKTYGTNQCVACITGILDTIPSNTTPNNIRLKSQELKSLASRMANSFITTNIKVIDYNVNTQNQLNRNSSNNQLLRYVNETIPHVSTNIIGDHSSNHTTTAGGSSVNSNVTTWRRDRSFMIIEECNPITETNTDLNVDSGDIVIKGYLRNKPLYINSLLHVVNVGTGAIKSVKLLNSTTGDSAQIKMSDASLQDSLKLMASPDYLQGEQTWPMENEEYSDEYLNEEGLAGIEGQGVDMNDESKPTDGYHDEWFEDENEDERIRKEAQVGGDLLDDVNSVAGSMVRENKYKSNLTSANLLGLPAKGKVNKKELLTQEILDRFQDEVDVPEMPMTVRKQFVKYRALQSFKYSDWHPKENLPLDYSKIYEFQQFSITQRRELNKIRTAASLQDTALIKQFDKKKNNVSESNNEVEMKDDETDSAAGPDPNYIPSGEYVEIVLTGLNFEAFQNNYQINGGFSVCYSLFKHENKLSVCHFNITPLPIYQELFCDGGCTNPTKKPDLSNILACKDEVVIQMGIRTPMICNPIYSESNLNCDKHKMSRYLIANSFTTATVFAPVTYLPCPVLVYARRPKTGPGSLMNDVTVTEATCISPVVDHDKNVCMSTQTELVLIATGVLDAVDPDRIILKKVCSTLRRCVSFHIFIACSYVTHILCIQAVLTGVPIRVKKRFGVVKYMFNEPQDVKYYQPAELVTKHGLRGHIREPVGTHGLFKAIFSAPVTQNDTVMLVLYKRVFPKLRSGEDIHNTANDGARVSDMDLE